MATKMLNLRKEYYKVFLEVIKGMRLKFSRDVHTLASIKILFYVAIANVLLSLWQL